MVDAKTIRRVLDAVAGLKRSDWALLCNEIDKEFDSLQKGAHENAALEVHKDLAQPGIQPYDGPLGKPSIIKKPTPVGQAERRLSMLHTNDGFSADMLQRLYERIVFQDKTLSIRSKLRMLDQLFVEQRVPGAHREALRRVKDECSAMKQVGIKPETVTYSDLRGGASRTNHIECLDS